MHACQLSSRHMVTADEVARECSDALHTARCPMLLQQSGRGLGVRSAAVCTEKAAYPQLASRPEAGRNHSNTTMAARVCLRVHSFPEGVCPKLCWQGRCLDVRSVPTKLRIRCRVARRKQPPPTATNPRRSCARARRSTEAGKGEQPVLRWAGRGLGARGAPTPPAALAPCLRPPKAAHSRVTRTQREGRTRA